jgi:hypothetical protein
VGSWASPGPPCSCNPVAAGLSYRDLGSQCGSRRSGQAAQVQEAPPVAEGVAREGWCYGVCGGKGRGVVQGVIFSSSVGGGVRVRKISSAATCSAKLIAKCTHVSN